MKTLNLELGMLLNIQSNHDENLDQFLINFKLFTFTLFLISFCMSFLVRYTVLNKFIITKNLERICLYIGYTKNKYRCNYNILWNVFTIVEILVISLLFNSQFNTTIYLVYSAYILICMRYIIFQFFP